MRADRYQWVSKSPEKTRQAGEALAAYLKTGDCIPLIGDMGTGKTTFVQGVARGLKIPHEQPVTSPSFTIVNRYFGSSKLFHIDLYRLDGQTSLDDLEIEEVLTEGGIVFIEWPQRILPLIPNIALTIIFTWNMEEETLRTLMFESIEPRFSEFFERLDHADSWD
ncbi:tRNA (adenosine(37)-N6)-threonylcarbamoyltransferase complex ATPase subunit type 1 TsaE [bacterium]|nr:tRNA (adenosine(37)-N6)-threonylcarbamoyltransferase complex ATPase subunit type 1 TsaE [candidate division CSSED10-310 bacterium]